MAEQNHYQFLQIEPTATRRAVRTAYRKALRRYHPDANSGCREGEQMLRKVLAAGRILCDPELRAEYDQQLKQQVHQQRVHAPQPQPQPTLSGGQQLTLFWNKMLDNGRRICTRFFNAEQAAATENRASRQRSYTATDFNSCFHREMKKNNRKRYQRGSDGIYRKTSK